MNGLGSRFLRVFIAVVLLCTVLPVDVSAAYGVELRDQQESSNSRTVESGSETNYLNLGYIYLADAEIEAGGIQQVVVGVDADVAFASAKMTYIDPSGSEQIIESNKQVDSAILFELETPFIGEYELLQVEAVLSTNEIAFVDLSLDNGNPFFFNAQEPTISLFARSFDPSEGSTSIYAIDDEGDLIQSTSIDEAASMSIPALTALDGGPLVVALDPGHGGDDSGAVGYYGILEKDVNWSIAQYCASDLESYSDVRVYITRSEDECPGLEARVQRAVDNGASVFVSIHNNSSSTSVHGAEVYYPNGSSYNYDVHVDGQNLAEKIQAQLVALGLSDRGIKTRDGDGEYSDGWSQDYYGVIRHARNRNIPAVIVEHAFISNPDDCAKLCDAAFLQQLARADAEGIAQAYGLSKGRLEAQGNGKLKFVYPNGSYAVSCWQYVGSTWYYFDSTGYALSGFQKIGSKKYYFDSSYAMVSGWQLIDGSWYYFGGTDDGVMKTGWQYLGGAWYYLDSTTGAMQSGWQTIAGKRYYLGAPDSGLMRSGWQLIDGSWYYFGGADDGVMKTGWQYLGGEWYYLDLASGAMQTGWLQYGGYWYYLLPSGIMATGTQQINGEYHVFDASGKWIGEG